MYFSSTLGGVICRECNESYGIPVVMHHKLRDFLKSLETTGFDKKNEFEEKATEKVCGVCFELLKGYINQHSPKKFHSTEILQEIC